VDWMFVQLSGWELSKEFTVRTFSSGQALIEERRNHIVSCSTYVKEERDTVFRAIRVHNGISARNTYRKESFK